MKCAICVPILNPNYPLYTVISIRNSRIKEIGGCTPIKLVRRNKAGYYSNLTNSEGFHDPVGL